MVSSSVQSLNDSWKIPMVLCSVPMTSGPNAHFSIFLSPSALSHLNFKMPMTVFPFKAAFKDFHLHSPSQHGVTPTILFKLIQLEHPVLPLGTTEEQLPKKF